MHHINHMEKRSCVCCLNKIQEMKNARHNYSNKEKRKSWLLRRFTVEDVNT